MIKTIIGLPGHFTEFCRDVSCAILERSGRAPAHEEVDTLAALARHVLQAGQTSLVVVKRPERAFVEAVRDAGRPFLLVLDDPRRAVLHRVEDGTAPIEAILDVGTSCACLTDFLDAPGAVRITHEGIGADLDGFVRRLLGFLGLSSEDPGLMALGQAVVVEKLPAIAVDPAEPDVSAKLDTVLGSAWGLATKAALGGYLTMFFDGKLGRLIAARDLFHLPEGSAGAELIDATGRPRYLAWGPYLRIPRGQWILRMTLAFSPELAGTPFTLDVTWYDGVAPHELARVSFTAISGRYVAQATFTHEDPSRPLEFRLALDKATFDGKVALGFAELERVEDEAPPDLGAMTELSEPV